MIPTKVFHSIACCIAILSSFSNSYGQKYDTVKCLVQVVRNSEIKVVNAWAVKSYQEGSMELELNSDSSGFIGRQTYLSNYNVIEFLEANKFNTLTNLWKPIRVEISGLRIYYLDEPQYMIYEWKKAE